jgi:hypothetical protein
MSLKSQVEAATASIKESIELLARVDQLVTKNCLGPFTSRRENQGLSPTPQVEAATESIRESVELIARVDELVTKNCLGHFTKLRENPADHRPGRVTGVGAGDTERAPACNAEAAHAPKPRC